MVLVSTLIQSLIPTLLCQMIVIYCDYCITYFVYLCFDSDQRLNALFDFFAVLQLPKECNLQYGLELHFQRIVALKLNSGYFRHLRVT